MVDVNKLKGAIVAKGLTQKDVAIATGEKIATVNARINKGKMDTKFAGQLIELLGLNFEQANEIFFAKKD